MGYNLPPGVTGNEYQITGECYRDCPHCDGSCDCANTTHDWVSDDTDPDYWQCEWCEAEFNGDNPDWNEICHNMPCHDGNDHRDE